MEKVRPWCGQPSDRGRLKNRTEQNERAVSEQYNQTTAYLQTCNIDCDV